MSAIDSFTHAHVANFFDLPVYWVLEKKPLIDLTDQVCDDKNFIDPYHLSIGGGSGEHPALIMKNDAVLFLFLSNINDIEEPNEKSSETDFFDYKMFKLSQDIKNKYLDKENDFKNINEDLLYWRIDQNQWPLETFIKISKEFEKYSTNTDSLIEKIIDATALFIMNEMPLENCIVDPQLIEFATLYKSNRWLNVLDYQKTCEQFIGFSGVLNSRKSGKIIRDQKVIWGFSLNDWIKENQKS